MSLTEFCTTDRQLEVIRLYETGISSRKIGRELNLDDGAVRQLVRSVKKRAEDRGYEPETQPRHAGTSGCLGVQRLGPGSRMGLIIGWVQS